MIAALIAVRSAGRVVRVPLPRTLTRRVPVSGKRDSVTVFRAGNAHARARTWEFVPWPIFPDVFTRLRLRVRMWSCAYALCLSLCLSLSVSLLLLLTVVQRVRDV